MAKRIIGVDFDDVVMDTFPAFLAFCNERYNEKFRVEDFTSFGYDKIWKLTKEQGIDRFITFGSSEAKKNVLPMAGAQETIRKLARIHDMHIITARPLEIAEGTHKMIDQYFPEMFKGVHFCSTDNGKNYHRPKPVVCEEINAAIHIEDHPVTAESCAEKGIKTLLFDRIWNRSEPVHKLITRIYSWEEIFKVLCRP